MAIPNLIEKFWTNLKKKKKLLPLNLNTLNSVVLALFSVRFHLSQQVGDSGYLLCLTYTCLIPKLESPALLCLMILQM